MDDESGRWQIGQFAELVGLSIPQLRRYDRMRLLEPDGREAQSGYRYYSAGQTGAARVIALLRSRPYGMRDFVVRDPDGHLFTLGRGEATLREVAGQYGLTAETISVDPQWLQSRTRP